MDPNYTTFRKNAKYNPFGETRTQWNARIEREIAQENEAKDRRQRVEIGLRSSATRAAPSQHQGSQHQGSQQEARSSRATPGNTRLTDDEVARHTVALMAAERQLDALQKKKDARAAPAAPAPAAPAPAAPAPATPYVRQSRNIKPLGGVGRAKKSYKKKKIVPKKRRTSKK